MARAGRGGPSETPPVTKPLDEIERDIAAKTRAYVVGPYVQRGVASLANQRSFAARLDEAVGLAKSASPFVGIVILSGEASIMSRKKCEHLSAGVGLAACGSFPLPAPTDTPLLL